MILVINTGGTFNKIYDKVKGELIVPRDCNAILDICERSFYGNLNIKTEGIIYKDSLYMDDDDRNELLASLRDCKEKEIIVIHGTDTVDVSIDFIRKNAPEVFAEKCVVFTGAMKPYSIEPVEASANLVLALSFLLYGAKTNGAFLAVNGLVGEASRVVKDRKEGKFKIV